ARPGAAKVEAQTSISEALTRHPSAHNESCNGRSKAAGQSRQLEVGRGSRETKDRSNDPDGPGDAERQKEVDYDALDPARHREARFLEKRRISMTIFQYILKY